MKRILLSAVAVTLMALAYIGYPFATAWTIREAIRGGDAAYLEHKVDWDSVRTTLRGSLTHVAFDMPDPTDESVETPSLKPGLWKRVKAYFGKGALDRFVASYVTPEGLPQLFAYRKMYRQRVHGEVEPEKTLANLPERLSAFWARVVRAEFKSLSAFEMEVKDKYDPDRHYVGLLELRGYEWKLTELRIRSTSQIARFAAAQN